MYTHDCDIDQNSPHHRGGRHRCISINQSYCLSYLNYSYCINSINRLVCFTFDVYLANLGFIHLKRGRDSIKLETFSVT